MASWGNQQDQQYGQDMEPDGNYKLKVDIDRACNAIEAGNANANGKALKVSQGETEILDQVTIDKDVDGTTLSITNDDENAGARALKVEGVAEFLGIAFGIDHQIFLLRNCKIETTSSGNILVLRPGTGENRVEICQDANLALVVNGGLVSDRIEMNDGGGYLIVQGYSLLHKLLDARGHITVGDPTNEDGGMVDASAPEEGERTLKLGTSDSTGEVSISRTGKTTKVKGDLTVLGDKLKLGYNSSASLECDGTYDLKLGTENAQMTNVLIARSGKVTKVNGLLQVEQKSILKDEVVVGPSDAAGEIDSGGSAEVKQDLKIGSGAGSNSVIIGKQDHTAIVDCNLRVGRNEIGGIHTSRIDAYGNNGNADHLNIGTQNHTTDVRISRFGQHARVLGDLQVDEELRVGPTGSAGQIDAGGTGAAQILKIGAQNTTANVELGRANQTVDMQCQARMNSNSIVMDNLASLVDGSEQVYNPAGHGFGPSIDWIIEGVTRFCVDQTGGHNV